MPPYLYELAVMSWPDVLGLFGVAALLSAYYFLQSGRWQQDAPVYSATNALGSGLILVSLAFDFNLASTVVEGAWFVISLYGLARLRKRF